MPLPLAALAIPGIIAGSGVTAAGGAGFGAGILGFFKNMIQNNKGNWIPYMLSAGMAIPSIKTSMMGKEMYDQGKLDYNKYIGVIGDLLSGRAAQHTALGGMISGGVQKGASLPVMDYAKFFAGLGVDYQDPMSDYGFSSGSTQGSGRADARTPASGRTTNGFKRG